MRFLITGGKGQLGCDIENELKRRYPEAIIYAPSHDELDITNIEEVNNCIEKLKPDIIFHTAAYTAVDKAETECKICYDINVNGTKNLIDAIKDLNSKFIYISTDYVFDGNKEGKYKETDVVNPINFYGKTKALGEEIALDYHHSFIIRTSWLYGMKGHNFVKTIIKKANELKSIEVVSDQVGSPTYTSDLAISLVDLSETNRYGIYNITNNGFTSFYEFASYVVNACNLDCEVIPVLSHNFKTLAKRPKNSCLDKSKLKNEGFVMLPNWQDALDRYINELYKEKEVFKSLGRNDI